MRDTRKQSFARGLPSSSLSLATRRFLVLSFLIACGRCDSVESNVDLVAFLRGTLKFWRQIYNTYYDEISLGYCWADYLFGLKDVESLTIPRFFQNDFTNASETSNGWRYENDSTNRGHFSYGNHSQIVTDAQSNHSYRRSPSSILDTNRAKIARRDVEEEYAFPRSSTNFQNDSFVPSNFSYKEEHPRLVDLIEFVRGSKKREENSRLKRLRRWSDRVAENVEGSFQERAASTRKLSSSSSLPKQKLATAHGFFFKRRDRARRHIEPYARNIFEKKAPTETGVKSSGSLATRKVFDRDKITAYVEESSSLEERSGSETEESKERKDISYPEEAETSLSMEKYDRRTDEGKREILLDGIESQGQRSSRFSLITRDRSVKRILSTLPEHPIFIAVLRTLNVLVRLGRLIMEIVVSSSVLSCTRDYLWGKAMEWIDS